jgi:Cu(I)/Ag(I) efflux system membrane fusion protein
MEILSGLAPDDEVVVSGQFLIDSESNLQASFMRMAEPETEPSPKGEGMDGGQAHVH